MDRKIKATELMYYLFIILYASYNTLRFTVLNTRMLNYLYYLAIPFLVYIMITTKYTKNELLKIGFFLVFNSIIAYSVETFGILINCLIVITLKRINIEKILKILFHIKLLIFLGLVLLSVFGRIENIQTTRFGHTTYAFGFSQYNGFGMTYMVIIVLLFFVYKEKICNFWGYTLILLSDILELWFSGSRTPFVCVLLLVVINIFYPYLKNVFFTIAPYITGIFLVMWYLIPNNISNPLISGINQLMTGRIYIAHMMMQVYPVRWFGRSVSRSVLWLDSGYIRLILLYGILFSCAWVFMFWRTGKIIKRYHLRYYLISMIIFSVFGLAESVYINVTENFTIMFWSFVFFGYKQNGCQNSNNIEENI